MNVIDKVTPLKGRWVKRNSQEWFDGEIADEIENRDKLLKNSKNQNCTLAKIFIMRQDTNYRK